MDYVCTVIGNLYIKDLHLDLSYMEIIDLSSDDLKTTPQIRDCLRNKQLEPYLPSKHPLAKKFRNRNSTQAKTPEVIKEQKVIINKDDSLLIAQSLNIITKLDVVADSLTKTMDKIDLLINSFREYELKKERVENTEIESLINKMDFLVTTLEVNQDSKFDFSKLDLLINKLDTFLSNLSKNSSSSFTIRENRIEQQSYKNQDAPIFVPELNLNNVGKKSIKAQELSSEGTDDILEKLKKLKKKEINV